MTFAERARTITAAPYIERLPEPTPKERYLRKDEVQGLIDSAEAPHMALAIHMLFATTGRVGTILDLIWDRVDLERGTINLRLNDAKTRKDRAIVPINCGLMAALQTARSAALSEHEWSGVGRGSYRQHQERLWRGCNASRTCRCDAAHDQAQRRRGNTSRGGPMGRVAQYLGHSNVAIT